MANGRPGKAVFEQRVEYPLPKRAGVKDYVFYFVGPGDGYGKSARVFFDRFYRTHVRRSASSLEEMIDFLDSEIANGLTQIRELVLVSHGAPQGLMCDVLRIVPADLRVLGDVTPRSLAVVQRAFKAANDARFTSFRVSRERVVKKLLTDSWVTVRACRVGLGDDLMYALFSFFGGRANVYAPREYQFFGQHPIAPGMRVESKIAVHGHLVKQRFYPRDVHSPERRDAIVASLIDPGRFGQPFDLASARLGDTTSTEAFAYQGMVDSMNRRRLNAPLKTTFAASGHDLSPKAGVRVSVRDAAWTVEDQIQHGTVNPVTASVSYDVGEVIETVVGGQRTTLRASARIADRKSTHDSFPIQLFFFESENNLWKGKVGTLASFLEEAGSGPDQARLDALVAAMPTTSAPAPLNPLLVSALADRAKIEPTAAARIHLASSEIKHGQEYRTWAIEDQEPYQIKLEHPVTASDVQGHMLSLLHARDGLAKVRAENELMAFLGQDPDTPGTELAAYLDRSTLEELLAMIDYLRSPYRPEHSFYIHHAQQAIKRKREYFRWSMDRFATSTDPLGPLTDPYESLVGGEAEDKRVIVHDFDFNGIWQDVKVSHPSLGIVNVDLFADEDLWTKFGADGNPGDAVAGLDLEADAPYSDLDEQRQVELAGLEEFSTIDKSAFEPIDPDLSCEELAAILTTWRDLQELDPAEIERQLGLLTASDGDTFLDHVRWLYDKYKIAKIGPQLMNISFMRDGIAVRIVSRIPVIGIVSEIGVPTTFTALLRIWPVITIPLTLWLKTIEAQAEAAQVWENTGKVTAARQWLRLLILETFQDDFPDNVEIDLGWHGSTMPHVDRYYQEQRDEYGVFFSFVWAPDRMKKGFDEGVRLMDNALAEILERGDDAVDSILREIDVSSCKSKVLVDSGLLDLRAVRGRVVRAIANDLLAKLPKV